MKKINRRAILKTAGLLGAGYITNMVTNSEPVKAGENSYSEMPWKYYSLNPQKTAQMAYDNYPGHGCMYAIVSSVISQLSQIYGAPYDQFPLNSLNYGHGGVGGYGSLCGALNGGAMLIGLFCHAKKESDLMIKQLYQWYENTELPNFVPSNSKFPENLPVVFTRSVICHASVSTWCMKAKVSPDNPIRKERCRRLCGDVVKKVISIMEDYVKNEVAPFAYTADDQKCMQCHGIEEAKMFKANTGMSCGSCHSDPHN